MPYGLKDEEFNKIQNKIVRKLYEIPSLERAPFLVGCTEQELRGAMTELRKTPKSKGKIEAVERELRNRGSKNKKTKFFPSELAEKKFAREWTKACGRIRGGRKMLKKLSIEDIDFEFIPASVFQDVDKRIADRKRLKSAGNRS